MSDPQKTRVYKAESSLHIGSPVDGDRGATSFVTEVLSSRWFRRTWPTAAKVSVSASWMQGQASYMPGQNRIALPERAAWAYTTKVLCHELAHHVAVDSHGPEFCGSYLWIVAHAIGQEEASQLQSRFDGLKVLYNPLTYILTEEELT